MLLDTRTMILAQRNGLTVRLALTPEDIRRAQHLRYRVFYEELSAKPDAAARATRLDVDRFDNVCDHLLVTDDTAAADQALVGTYRLLRQDVARRHGGFYAESEFDLAPLLQKHRDLNFLEVGRSCVAPGFRGKPVAELLWQGIWNYVRFHKLDVMLGCASLQGTDVDALADALTYLANARPMHADWSVSALPHLHVEMQRKALATVSQTAVIRNLPTLVKAYLRLGCHIGNGAVIDHQFNTTDVLIVLPVSDINPRYFNHYGAPV